MWELACGAIVLMTLLRSGILYQSNNQSVCTITEFAGSKGKTTTSWLVRGIFEEMQLVTGMVGSLEYSIAVDKLTVNGDMWKAEKKDITLDR